MVKPEKFGHLDLVYHFTVPLSIGKYFRVSNRRGGQNKRGGWQILAKIINGKGAINEKFGKNLQS